MPVVVAPAGRALGGGCEIVMHGQHVRAAVETYMGLVEVGVGVIPAGGGCKELLARWQAMIARGRAVRASRHAFEVIAVATVATSAARRAAVRLPQASDAVTLDRERLLADAQGRRAARWPTRSRVASGSRRRRRPSACPASVAGWRWSSQVDNLRLQGKVSEHDAVVAGKLAYVLTGGECSPLDVLDRAGLLDLEREAFVSLCGMPKTQARMEYTLKTGKPLRN